jgi:hypothetical protein
MLEGAKDAPKPLLNRAVVAEDALSESPLMNSNRYDYKGLVNAYHKTGMLIAEQSQSRQPRLLQSSEEEKMQNPLPVLNTLAVASSEYAPKAAITTSFAHTLPEDALYALVPAEEKEKHLSATGKSLIPAAERLELQEKPFQREDFSHKMSPKLLPAVPDLNPKLLRQLEHFQRSQRVWTKVSLPMEGGEDLMLRMKVSSGRIQIRFGTQSVALRDGLERGWSELVNQAASRGIQLDLPEFEARLKTRVSPHETALTMGLSEGDDKPLKSFKKRNSHAEQSIGPNEAFEDYPGVFKWA